MTKPREFWIKLANYAELYDCILKVPAKVEGYIHVREVVDESTVVPGETRGLPSIDWEKVFREYYRKINYECGIEEHVIQDLVERALNGKL